MKRLMKVKGGILRRAAIPAFIAVLAVVAVSTLLLRLAPPESADRWYGQAQVVAGEKIYQQNCLSCHGAGGGGLVKEWRRRLADGSYPPPPLDGTAHTWHHPLSVLERTIRDGTAPLGGNMPAFGKNLTKQQRLAVIAYLQSHWTEGIYRQWLARGGEQR